MFICQRFVDINLLGILIMPIVIVATGINWAVLICSVFPDFLLFMMSGARRLVDLGAQSGNETQFVFSEGDVCQSDADDIRQLPTSRFIIPSSCKLL